jgi:hypothetical protein
MMVRGVPAGASTPYQPMYSKPASPDSATVGTLGAVIDRRVLLTAIARSRPDLTYG